MVEIKAGDVVQLKSKQGPEMTVDYIGNKYAHCIWFDGFNLLDKRIKIIALRLPHGRKKETSK